MVGEGEVTELRVTLPIRWRQALDQFAASPIVREYFGPKFQDTYVGVRGGEEQRFHNLISELDYQWYLRQV